MSFEPGPHWKPADFGDHLATLPPLDWAESVTVHHTAYPDLSMRPDGWTEQHMRNLAAYYGRDLGWSAGPHLFADEDQVFQCSPLTARGVHAVSFNATSIGIEMLGDYDNEDPDHGRGGRVLATTAAAVELLLEKLGRPITEDAVRFHREDPRTSKTCPGRRVEKEAFLELVRQARAHRRRPAGEAGPDPESQADRAGPDDLAAADHAPHAAKIAEALERVAHAEWQLRKIREGLS